ncbi:MAG: hypothetical protein IPI06_01545 [Gammaproteobacteria bacterium]|nr:hypothetical protein [Gammaproteobacteria bacterium]
MDDLARQKYLTIAVRVIGLVLVFGIYPLTVLWPSGWSWHPGQSEYLHMIIAIYVTLGVFLILVSARPEKHLSLISFAIWSSIVHAAVMAVQAVVDTGHIGHLYGDVPALFVVAGVLGWLCPRALTLRFLTGAT